jgi:hypothetical protein
MNANEYFYGLRPAPTPAQQTGPKTPEGKAIAARNSTSHGLFARDVVLIHLGENPDAFEALRDELCQQIQPINLIEQHYVEQIAAASWRLRRLDRWQAQIYEDEQITEDARFDKLDRVIRYETTLRRQIDKAVRLLGRTGTAVASPMPEGFNTETLDNNYESPTDREERERQAENKKCENEMPERDEAQPPTLDGFYVYPDGRPSFMHPKAFPEYVRLRDSGDKHEARKFWEAERRREIGFLAGKMVAQQQNEAAMGPEYANAFSIEDAFDEE